MIADVTLLRRDLEDKFNHLCDIHNHPAYFVSEYFSQVRNNIDHDAVSIFCNGIDDQKINSLYIKYIELLNEIEKEITSQIPAKSFGSNVTYATLKRRIEQFSNALNKSGDFEVGYVELALEIINETNALLKRLFGNQTLIYFSSNKPHKLGTLIHLKDEYLKLEEINALRSADPWVKCDLKTAHMQVQKALNRSLMIDADRRFILTKNTFILMWITNLLKSERGLESKFVCYRDCSNNEFGFTVQDAEVNKFIIGQCASMEIDALKNLKLEGLEDSENLLRHFIGNGESLCLSGNRLEILGSQLFSLANQLTSLDLSDNQLKILDEDMLAKCVNLTSLKLENAFSPNAKFNIGFLKSLSNLQSLYLTLPAMPIDFDVFKQLTKLRVLHLNGYSATEISEKRFILTNGAFTQLSLIPRLDELVLSFFEIEVIDQYMLRGFKKLHTLCLTNNRIKNIHEDAFYNCLSRLRTLNLGCNQISDLKFSWFTGQENLKEKILDSNKTTHLISNTFRRTNNLKFLTLNENNIENLPPGVFDGLINLEKLDLRHNSIKKIRCGVFDELERLCELRLDNNPIEKIEANAFIDLENLESLSLENCQLESINNQMFRGLDELRHLSLANNRISSIEVMARDKKIKCITARATLTSKELRVVVKYLFRDLMFLTHLSLAGNRLEKLDLNIFHNLNRLEVLDLSSNLINELNSAGLIKGNLESLTHLNLSNNQLTSIDVDAFSESTELRQLNLSNNRLEMLDEDFFEPFQDLQSLELQNNVLSMTISKHKFADSIKNVNLLGNKMMMIEKDAFSLMPKLKSLKFDYVDMPENCFKSLSFSKRNQRLSSSNEPDGKKDQ